MRLDRLSEPAQNPVECRLVDITDLVSRPFFFVFFLSGIDIDVAGQPRLQETDMILKAVAGMPLDPSRKVRDILATQSRNRKPDHSGRLGELALIGDVLSLLTPGTMARKNDDHLFP